MQRKSIISRALLGGELEGDKLVRFIYVDEAGISANEPVTVVVGLIIHADTQWRLSEAKVREVLEAVPDCFRQNFIFHAKTVWGSKIYREKWNMKDRLAFLREMMSIPYQLNIPIALSIGRRNAEIPHPKGLAKEKFQHAMAFVYCMAKADAYLKRYGEPGEVATIVAEDVPNLRRFFRALLPFIRDRSSWLDSLTFKKGEMLNAEDLDPSWKISRIIDTVHFTEKAHAPLLQIADACAYGFRRFFSGQTYGMHFVSSILGGVPSVDDFSHRWGNQLVIFDLNRLPSFSIL